MTRTARFTIGLVVTVIASACGGGGDAGSTSGSGITGPKTDPGALGVVLDGAPADLGAVVVTISARSIGTFTASGLTSSTAASADQISIMLRGTFATGTLGELQVGDRSQPYAITVVEAAAGRSGNYRNYSPTSITMHLAKR